MQVDGDGAAFLAGRFQRGRQRRQLVDFAFPFLDRGAGGVVAANCGSKEPKLGLFTHHQAEFLARHIGFGPLFHAERNDTERLDRRGRAGDRGT